MTLAEYALGVALIALAGVGAAEALADDAGDRLGERSAGIGAPGDEALGGHGGGSGSGSDGDDGEVPPPPPPAPYTGSISFVGCTGAPARNLCSYSLTVDPAPVVATWSVNPSQHVTGSGGTGISTTLQFTHQGTYSVRATVGTRVVQFEMICTRSGPNVSCNAVT